MTAESKSDELIAFVAVRLAEDESQAQLFHELGCAVAPGPGEVPRRRCHCPTPAWLTARVHALQRVLRDCEKRIRRAGPEDPDRPLGPTLAEVHVRAVALRFEEHPQWREEWRP
ncbi:DUF6221 family protein [Streptomyces phaeochromogenes]|uniref:DUF6221 family protein n=1 Tax=Streptomyces phaeochromogenes TaxID=1923 RepID=UPI002E28A20A|nr:DUF6221 family protein [Streptomyces phaeochromogenes]